MPCNVIVYFATRSEPKIQQEHGAWDEEGADIEVLAGPKGWLDWKGKKCGRGDPKQFEQWGKQFEW